MAILQILAGVFNFLKDTCCTTCCKEAGTALQDSVKDGITNSDSCCCWSTEKIKLLVNNTEEIKDMLSSINKKLDDKIQVKKNLESDQIKEMGKDIGKLQNHVHYCTDGQRTTSVPYYSPNSVTATGIIADVQNDENATSNTQGPPIPDLDLNLQNSSNSEIKECMDDKMFQGLCTVGDKFDQTLERHVDTLQREQQGQALVRRVVTLQDDVRQQMDSLMETFREEMIRTFLEEIDDEYGTSEEM